MGSSELRDKWRTFIENLTDHENTHKGHASSGANEVLTNLNTISGHKTCAELDQVINTEGNKILEGVRSKDKSFDEETDHGRNKGVVFP